MVPPAAAEVGLGHLWVAEDRDGICCSLGGCCESREVVKGDFWGTDPLVVVFLSISFLARVHGQFGETWAFLGMFGLIPTPKGVQTAQGLHHGAVAHFPLGIFLSLCAFRCPCGGQCQPRGFCCVVVLQMSRAREKIDSRTGIIQPCALINMCLQFLTKIPRAGCTSPKLPVPVAFVVT